MRLKQVSAKDAWYKITQTEFSSLNINHVEKNENELQQTDWLWQHIKFYQNQLGNFWENECTSFWFPMQLWPCSRSRSSKLVSKCLYHQTKFEKKSPGMEVFWLFFFFDKNRQEGFSPLHTNQTRQNTLDSHQVNKSQQSTNSIQTAYKICTEDIWHRTSCFLAYLWPWMKVKVT